MTAVLEVLNNVRAKARGLSKESLKLLDEALAEVVEGSQWSPRSRRFGGGWDGKRHFFAISKVDEDTGTFPKGLLHRVKALLTKAKVEFEVVDHRKNLYVPKLKRIKAGMLKGIKMSGDYSYQLKALRAAIEAEAGVLHLATNAGKCLAPETRVLLYSGRRVRADKVAVGMQLMGPDGTPRTVRSTSYGRDAMYRVTANRGDNAFTCNSVHVLTLDTGESGVVDVPLNEFLHWTKDAQHRARLVTTGVDFPLQQEPAYVEPWLLGLWYADGRKDLTVIEITKPDVEIEEALRSVTYVRRMELKAQRSKDRCVQWRLVTERGQPNDLLRQIRDAYGDGSRLPERYLRGTADERRAFLAGIIDGDGYSCRGSVEVTWQHRRWANDLAFLARSLGFLVSVRKKLVRLPTWTEPRTYWRVMMTGDTRALPLKLDRKHAVPAKNWTRVGFTVEPVDTGPYAGFTLDGDGRFVLGDFTVTHNTEIAAGMMQVLRELNVLFVVPKKTLLHQTRERIAMRLGTVKENIGVIGDGRFDPKDITIAIINSITPKGKPGKRTSARTKARNRILLDYLSEIDCVFLDEGHHAKATTWYKLMGALRNAQFRYLLSGTPYGAGKDLMIESAAGPTLYRVRNKELMDLGVSAKPIIRMITVNAPEIADGTWDSVYKDGIVYNVARNALVAREARKFSKAKKSTLILIRQLAQGDALLEALRGTVRQVEFVHGKMPTSVVEDAKERFKEKAGSVLIASQIFDEGVDIPDMRALIVADGGQSLRSTLQKIGRGIRKKKGGDNVIEVVDFADCTHQWLAKHALERYETYEAEEFDVIEEEADEGGTSAPAGRTKKAGKADLQALPPEAPRRGEVLRSVDTAAGVAREPEDDEGDLHQECGGMRWRWRCAA